MDTDKVRVEVEQRDLRLFLEVIRNGLDGTVLPRDVKRRLRKLLKNTEELCDIIEMPD